VSLNFFTLLQLPETFVIDLKKLDQNYQNIQKEIHPDILVIIQSPKLNMQRLIKTYNPKEIVVDGSNFKSYIRIWEETCRKEKIPFHYTNEKGFYKI
jgi:hypothetical protein